MRGHAPEGRVHLLAALERPDLPDSPARAHALLGSAILLIEQEISPQAITFAHESLERFRADGDTSGAASVLLLLGHIGLRVLHMEYACSHLFTSAGTRGLLVEGLALCRKLGWGQASALVLVHLGLLAQMEGDTEQSRSLREEGWGLLDRGDEGRTPAYCLNFMNTLTVTLYVAAGERALLERSLALTRRTGKKRRVVAIVHSLGKVADCQGDIAFAITCFREAAEIYREMGNTHALSEALQQLGNAYYHLGDYRSAAPIYTESLELFRQLGYTVDRAANNLGSTLFHLGEPEQARTLHREALADYGDNSEGIAWSLERFGVVEVFYGEPTSAARILGAAAAARRQVGRPRAPWDQADWDRAVASLRAALGEQEIFWLGPDGLLVCWINAMSGGRVDENEEFAASHRTAVRTNATAPDRDRGW